MAGQDKSRVLIVGGGAMGIVYGYLLSNAGAEVTFLVRPHRAQAFEKPQILYSYNDHQLKTFKDFKYITDPSHVAKTKYDFILVTLDGTALSNETGQALVKTIGEAVKGTDTLVLLGAIKLDLKSWFLKLSGLRPEQVVTNLYTIHAYSPKLVTLPLHEPTNKELLSQADIAFSDNFPMGFMIDDTSPELTKRFIDLYDATGASACVVVPATKMSLDFMPFFSVFVASEILGWPNYRDIHSSGDVWSLTVEAIKEIQRLDMCGEQGPTTAQATTADGFKQACVGMEQMLLPLDLQAFNKYHHGGKCSVQDRQVLRDFVARGKSEGKSMSSLEELLDRADAQSNGT